MRAAFAKTLVELAERDSRVLLLTGDLGFMALEPFSQRFPDRFFNVGVAEQNMVGIATGLAEAGYLPFVYSIVTFATLRSYEFVRNGPVHHRLPVRIVGMGGGFEYGSAGPTHYGLEDVGVMRMQPGITVIAPADFEQARTALLATWSLPGPVYYRLGKDDKTVVPGLAGKFELGRAQSICEGSDLLLIAMGAVSIEAFRAAEFLRERGLSAAVMVVASVSPPPTEDLAAAIARFPIVLTVEAHYANGGLGSLVAEIMAARNMNCRHVACAVHEPTHGRSGGTGYLHQVHGLSADTLAHRALRELHGTPS